MRRRLLRGLYYIGVGNDIDGKIDTSEAPIIANPELKQAAEQGRFSLAFIGSVAYLISLLLEAEGIGVDLIAQHYIQAAMGIALRANPLNMIWDPPSEFAVLEARKWMKRAGEIARFLRTPADQDMLDAFKQAEELFNSGNVTCAQYMAYQQQVIIKTASGRSYANDSIARRQQRDLTFLTLRSRCKKISSPSQLDISIVGTLEPVVLQEEKL